MTLTERLAEMHPEPGPLTAEQVGAALSSLGAETIEVSRPIGSKALLKWATAYNVMAALISLRKTPPSDAIAGIVEGAYLTVSRADTELDLTDPEVATLVAALRSLGAISDPAHAALVAMSRALVPAWPGLTVESIHHARGL